MDNKLNKNKHIVTSKNDIVDVRTNNDSLRANDDSIRANDDSPLLGLNDMRAKNVSPVQDENNGLRAKNVSPLPQRRSVRLDGYDYSSEGLYFITICCKNFKCLFGEIYNGVMQLNAAGNIAQQCWLEIPKHYPQVQLHEFVIMPNHIHGIIEIVGAKHFSPALNHHSTEKKHFSPKQNENNGLRANNDSPIPRGTSNTIGAMVRGFKIGVTKWMKQNTTVTDVWQRSFYEHIIKTEKSHENIANYIIENPINWSKDKFYAVGANHHSPEKKHFSPENNHHSPEIKK